MLTSALLFQARNMLKLGATHFIECTGPKHTATVIVFHGSGDTGGNMKEWVNIMARNKFTFPHIKVIFPTAPLQPYTPNAGHMSNVWFDRAAVSPNFPEKLESLASIELEIKELIKKENDAGIPNSRIIVGGFSMGGTLALHTAYRWYTDLAGVFVFSSFLNENSIVYEQLKRVESITKLPPLLQLHGNDDEMVELKWGQDTFSQLTSVGVKGEFIELPSLGHSINQKGIRIIKEWVENLLSPI